MISPDQWIERYRRAWETGDSDEVVDLFTPAASYRSSVFREPRALHHGQVRHAVLGTQPGTMWRA